MDEKKARGIIGITDDGQPIITADYQCLNFIQHEDIHTDIKECWNCKFADFRKSYEITLKHSICRCRENRVNVEENRKNETYQQPLPLIETFVSKIKGGVITCIFDIATLSSKAVYLNEGWAAITGYTLEALNCEMNGNPQALVHPDDKATADFEYDRQMMVGNEYALLYRVIHKNGATIWVIDRGVMSVLPNGNIQNQSIITEITEIKEQEEHLRRLAQHDQLTDLYNKVTFTQQANMVLAQQCDKRCALIILDIDDFKKVNDSMGHAYGDKVLKLVADCLKGLFRNCDLLGRIGGDEFMILMTDISGGEIVKQKASALGTAICGCMIDGCKEIFVTVSLGIAISNDEANYDELFMQADVALYRAKKSGKNQALFFNDISG